MARMILIAASLAAAFAAGAAEGGPWRCEGRLLEEPPAIALSGNVDGEGAKTSPPVKAEKSSRRGGAARWRVEYALPAGGSAAGWVMSFPDGTLAYRLVPEEGAAWPAFAAMAIPAPEGAEEAVWLEEGNGERGTGNGENETGVYVSEEGAFAGLRENAAWGLARKKGAEEGAMIVSGTGRVAFVEDGGRKFVAEARRLGAGRAGEFAGSFTAGRGREIK